MRPDTFEAQITRLLQEGYEAATFSEAVAHPVGRRLVVTFDDAFASVLEIGKPILDRLGVPGTLYVPTAFADSGRDLEWPGIDQWKDGPHAHELRCLGWEQLRRLADDGWEIGSHSVDHPRLTQLADDELDRQLADSKAACERELVRACTSIAYPYGDIDGRVALAARRAGYATGAALPARWHRADPLCWPRVGIYNSDSARRFALKTSRTLRMVRGLVEPRLPRRGA